MAVPYFKVILDLSVSLTSYKQCVCKSGRHACHILPPHEIKPLLFTSTAGPLSQALTQMPRLLGQPLFIYL